MSVSAEVEDAGAVAREKRGRLARALAVVFVAVVAVAALTGQSGANARYAAVVQARAGVHEALGRMVRARGLARESGQSAEQWAASGHAQVDAQKRRYDEAVAAYNAYAGGFPGGLWARMAGLPRHAPSSREVSWW